MIRPSKNNVSEVRELTLFSVIIISNGLRLHKSHLPDFTISLYLKFLDQIYYPDLNLVMHQIYGP